MPEYEIELTDYFRIIWRRKWLIALGTLLVVVIAAMVSVVLPKTYEAVGLLRVGEIAGRFIDSPVAVRAQITSTPYAEKYIQSKGLNLPASDFRLRVEAGPRIEIIRLTANGPSGETIQDFLRYVVEDTVSSHKRTYREVQELKDQREQELKNQISRLEERIAQIKKDLTGQDSRRERREPATLILEGALIGMEAQLSGLKNSYTDFMLRSALVESSETRLLSVKVAAHPVRPNLKLNILVAIILGFMVFMALSLFLEYNQRKEQKK